jgi:hypothetical protein
MVQSGETDTCACIDFHYMYTTKLYSSPCTKFILAVCTIRVYVSKTLLSMIMHVQCRHDEKDQILCLCRRLKNHPVYLFSCNLSEDHVKSSSSGYQQLDLAEAVSSAVSAQLACSCKLPSLWPPAPLLRQDADQGQSSSLQPEVKKVAVYRWTGTHLLTHFLLTDERMGNTSFLGKTT